MIENSAAPLSAEPIAQLLVTVAEKFPEVFTAGVSAGEKSEYDTFWDNFQVNGTRGNYNYAFYSVGWTDDNFAPKYDIGCDTSTANRTQSIFHTSRITDLKAILERQGVYLDFTNLRSTVGFAATFESSKITHIGRIKFPEYVSSYSYTFSNCTSLHTIDEMHLSPDGSTAFGANIFNFCNNLENITITGVIGQNGFDIHWSTNLTKASILSILNALSTTTSGLIVTFSKAAVDREFADGSTIGSQSYEWLSWERNGPEDDGRNNWTFDLI